MDKLKNAISNDDITSIKKILKNEKHNSSLTSFYFINWAVANCNVLALDFLLNDKRFTPSIEIMEIAAVSGNIDIMKLILKDGRLNPATYANGSLSQAINYSHIEMIKLLLKDERIDPSSLNNKLIIDADFNDKDSIVELLWEDKRIKKSLKTDLPNLYNKLMKKNVYSKIGGF
jgi:hypothetical protein